MTQAQTAPTISTPLTPYTGVYATEADHGWGAFFSPLIINGDGTINVAGALTTPTYVPENPSWTFGPISVTGVLQGERQTATVYGGFGFGQGTNPPAQEGISPSRATEPSPPPAVSPRPLPSPPRSPATRSPSPRAPV
ncbi:hypothetical protein [Actinospica robiniae]|uniref:hypothetical protein n=1 Tax=Actinospica robiniae TaxID=304901 RepID=UPI00041EA896|nr:hypothetical protein [Actinospica robiniae]